MFGAAGAGAKPSPTVALSGTVATTRLNATETYIDQIANLGGAAVTTLTQMNGGTSSAASSYSPKANGTLLKICVQITPQAASSLAQSGYVQLVCTTWAPVNTLIIPFTGFGLQTVPTAGPQGTLEEHWYPPIGDADLTLPVNTAVPITASVIYFYSPVTPNIVVEGQFSTV